MPQRYDAVIIGGGHNGLVSRRVPRAGRPQDPRPGAPPRPGRRRRDRGDRPGLPVLRRELRRQPAAAGDHPRPQPAAVRPRHPPARRHVHAAAQGRQAAQGRRLPVARQRPRADGPRAAPLVEARRRGVRGVRPAHGRDGPVHQADPGHRPGRPDRHRPAAAAAAGRPRPPVPAAPRAPAGGVRPADDDVGRGLPRPVVRDRPAQGDDVGVRDHRHLPGDPQPGHGVRAAPPLHGRDRRRVPRLGHPQGRHRRRQHVDRPRGRGARRGDPHRGARRPGHRPQRQGDRRRARERRGDRGDPRPVARADAKVTFLDLLEPGTLEPEFEQEVRRFKFRGSSGKVNLAVDALPDFTSLPGDGRAPPRRDLVLALDGRDGARLRRREVRPLERAPVHRHDHPHPRRPRRWPRPAST